MKRTILASIAIFSLFIATGCQGDQKPDETMSKEDNETFHNQESKDNYNSGETSLDTSTTTTGSNNNTQREMETARDQDGKVNNDPNGVNKSNR